MGTNQKLDYITELLEGIVSPQRQHLQNVIPTPSQFSEKDRLAVTIFFTHEEFGAIQKLSSIKGDTIEDYIADAVLSPDLTKNSWQAEALGTGDNWGQSWQKSIDRLVKEEKPFIERLVDNERNDLINENNSLNGTIDALRINLEKLAEHSWEKRRNEEANAYEKVMRILDELTGREIEDGS